MIYLKATYRDNWMKVRRGGKKEMKKRDVHKYTLTHTLKTEKS